MKKCRCTFTNPLLMSFSKVIGTELDCDGTQVSSFKDATIMPHITGFNCRRTPLANQKFLNLMVLIAFGKSITKVNGFSVTSKTKALAAALTPKLRPLIVAGWNIVARNPIRLVHSETRRHKTIFCDESNADHEEEEVVEVFECDEEEQQPTEAPEISEESPEDARLRERFNALAASALSELPCDLLPIPLRAQSRAKSHTE